MASTYALPSSALPHAHRQHMHPAANAHAHSHSPPSFTSIKSTMSGHAHGSSTSLSHAHSHDAHPNGYTHDRNDSYTSSNGYAFTHKQSDSIGSSSSVPQSKVVSRTASSHTLHVRERPASMVLPDSWKTDIDRRHESPHAGEKIRHADVHEHHGHGPDHDHDHDHSHDHAHDHGHDHSHSHDHNHDHSHDHDHKHSHAANGHAHAHAHAHTHDHARPSLLSRILLRYSESVPFLHTILAEKDSRRIFYFLTLNFSFMGVQAFYAYATSSLGLLSDTVHMFFDCFALLVGLCAAVMSKWPPSETYPYGLGKVETLSGFANGILLILLSVEIIGEAAERMVEGTPPKRLSELLTISVLGGLVNAVGLMGFGHHHHHGHDHGGGGCPSSNKKDDDHKHSHAHGGQHDHGHHHNENMEGIFLHVMADLMGSVAVVISTLLTMYTGWTWWDAVAGIAVSVLIAMAAWPLLKSSARNLLLSIPAGTEYNLRNTLAGIVQQRGVVGYSVPKFWVDDIQSSAGGRETLRGIVHVVAARGAGLEDVRDRVREYLLSQDMDITVQVEREGDTACWCGSGRLMSPVLLSPRAF